MAKVLTLKSTVDFLKEAGAITTNRQWLHIGDEKFNGVNNLSKRVKEDSEFKKRIDDLVKKIKG